MSSSTMMTRGRHLRVPAGATMTMGSVHTSQCDDDEMACAASVMAAHHHQGGTDVDASWCDHNDDDRGGWMWAPTGMTTMTMTRGQTLAWMRQRWARLTMMMAGGQWHDSEMMMR